MMEKEKGKVTKSKGTKMQTRKRTTLTTRIVQRIMSFSKGKGNDKKKPLDGALTREPGGRARISGIKDYRTRT